ncbi:MAG: carbamoyltransferase [Candidatus Omnitrophica bacterium]|nr:carbamoyltransferase [Candidatus Omnitrophota bacterium]
MRILGISAYYHDSAACLVDDGRIIAAAQEERFTRKKHDARFPSQAARFCLDQSGLRSSDLDAVVFYDKPFIKFERLIQTYLAYTPLGLSSFMKAMPAWIKQKLWTRDVLREELSGYSGRIFFTEHHESHAASAFFPSPFSEAAILTMDGVGEWATASFGCGRGNRLEIEEEIVFPHSLGLLYSAFTYFTGFRVNSGEYKLMGLAPYGDPVYKDLILKELVDLKEDGSFRLNMKYFNYPAGLEMTSKRFDRLFGRPRRKPEAPITQQDMDIARSIQEVTEEIVLRIARYVRKKTGMRNLCLAGGVALNCVANGRLLREGTFENIWIQPAAGDSGGALGAALFAWHQILNNPRSANEIDDSLRGSYLGPEYSDAEIERFLLEKKIPYERIAGADLLNRTADLIAEEKVVGWFQGRMEFGPRALGNRSILGDARSPRMQEIMNLKIKFRESFRPFAPAVLRDQAADYFQLTLPSPYMLIVAPIAEKKRVPAEAAVQGLFGIDKLKLKRSEIPAVTHVDCSARIQTVDHKMNPLFHGLLTAMHARHGCPLVINTSFNVRGEPIVLSPADAYRCFMRTGMDYLVLGSFLIDKAAQRMNEGDTDWQTEYQPD